MRTGAAASAATVFPTWISIVIAALSLAPEPDLVAAGGGARCLADPTGQVLPHRLVDVLAADVDDHLPVVSPAAERARGLMLDRQWAPNLPVRLVQKGLRYLAASAPRWRWSTRPAPPTPTPPDARHPSTLPW